MWRQAPPSRRSGNVDYVNDVAFSPDGKTIASASHARAQSADPSCPGSDRRALPKPGSTSRRSPYIEAHGTRAPGRRPDRDPLSPPCAFPPAPSAAGGRSRRPTIGPACMNCRRDAEPGRGRRFPVPPRRSPRFTCTPPTPAGSLGGFTIPAQLAIRLAGTKSPPESNAFGFGGAQRPRHPVGGHRAEPSPVRALRAGIPRWSAHPVRSTARPRCVGLEPTTWPPSYPGHATGRRCAASVACRAARARQPATAIALVADGATWRIG